MPAFLLKSRAGLFSFPISAPSPLAGKQPPQLPLAAAQSVGAAGAARSRQQPENQKTTIQSSDESVHSFIIEKKSALDIPH